MKARCLAEAGRIWCCLGLHTEGFQQELAVKLVAGKRIPLQPVDVATETGIRKQNIRRGMLQLQAWGLGEIKGDEHHQVRLYAWVNPRDVDPAAVAAQDPWSAVPAPLKPWFRRFKIQPDHGFDFVADFVADFVQEVDAAARDYLSAVDVLKSVLSRTRATDPIQKNGEQSEKNPQRPSVRPVQPPPTAPPPRRPPDAAEDVEAFLLTELGDSLPGETPSRSLCLQIASVVADMPLEELLPLIRRKRCKIASMGMVLPLAREVRQRWERDAAKRRRAAEQSAQAQADRDRAFATEILRCPDAANDDEKRWARQILNATE